jgi:hypothetical protein
MKPSMIAPLDDFAEQDEKAERDNVQRLRMPRFSLQLSTAAEKL